MEKIFIAHTPNVEMVKKMPNSEQAFEVLQEIWHKEFPTETKLKEGENGLGVYYNDICLGRVELLDESLKGWAISDRLIDGDMVATWNAQEFSKYPHATHDELVEAVKKGHGQVKIIGHQRVLLLVCLIDV